MTTTRTASSSSSGEANRYGLLLFATLYTFFFVGALFGWGPMQRLLEGSGAFHSKCTSTAPTDESNQDDLTCPAQSTTIINVNFIAICTNTLTPLIGQAIDHYRAPTVATWFMAPCAVTGSALLVVAATYHLDALYYAAFMLLGLATFTGSLLSVQVGLYFGGTFQVRVIMFLNALFDAGSVTYLLLWGLESLFGLDFVHVTIVYFCLAVCQYGGAIYFWNVATPESVVVNGDGTDESHALILNGNDNKNMRQKHAETVMESLREFQAAHMDNKHEIQAMLTSYRTERATGGRPSVARSVR